MPSAGQTITSAQLNALGCPVAPLTATAPGSVTSGSTEIMDAILGVYTFTAAAGVRYKMILSGRAIAGSVADARYSLKLRYTLNGGTPVNTSTLIDHDQTSVPHVTTGNGVAGAPLIVTFMPGAGVVRVMSSWQLVNGTGTGTPTGGCALWAEGIGFV